MWDGRAAEKGAEEKEEPAEMERREKEEEAEEDEGEKRNSLDIKADRRSDGK